MTLKVESTNYSTCLSALEQLVRRMKQMQAPSGGEVIEEKYWRLTVLETMHPLDEKTERKTRNLSAWEGGHQPNK